ncbi:MAG: hypothetical protein BGO13_10650 [Burkholderiales bacterium 66-5]|uniref:hypothetical protein n=1 Tax=Comamonas badia TaxID=265291 RepID=UPI00041143A1|nr:hypothetical protein [Comamonas badia]OJU89716.1 MAG: hypothetical protein BGO13_10650 [Burkholderiales bacterium 66-5]
MFKNSLQSLVVVATLVFAGATGSAPVQPVAPGVNGAGGWDGAQNQAQVYTADHFYDTVAGAIHSVTDFMLGTSVKERVPVHYFLLQGTGAEQGEAAPGAATQVALAESVPHLAIGQNSQYALPQGQYILQIQKTAEGWKSTTTNLADVPLPGALWMFGAALVGFIGVSSRRKV